jgi:hypothetical protein
MATTQLTRTLSASDLDKWTFSTWVKKSGVTGYQHLIAAVNGSAYTVLKFETGGQISFENYDSGGSNAGQLKTSAVFRDPTAWYHVVAVWDSDNGSAGDRMRLYVNGVEETSFATDSNPASDEDSTINSAVVHYIGARDGSDYLNGVLAHTHFCDGQAYAATDFGETDSTSGIWVPKTGPSVTYGTNGFFLKYASGAEGTDSSGESNDFVVSGTMTQTKDTPDNNFATWSPLIYGASSLTIGNGNNAITAVADTSYHSIYGTMAVNTGKWYWEIKAVNVGSASGRMSWGIGDVDNLQNANPGEVGDKSNAWTWDNSGGYKTGGSGGQESGDYLSYTTGDIIAFALDCDNSKLYLAKNNTWQKSGDPTSGATGTGAISITADITYIPGGNMRYTTNQAAMNFGNGYFGTTAVTSAEADGNGEGQFEYAPPTGYFAMCTNNFGSES